MGRGKYSNKSREADETEGILRRIHELLVEELDNIKKQRKERGMLKVGDRLLTKMFPKHKHWEKIKEDLIVYEFDNQGRNGGS